MEWMSDGRRRRADFSVVLGAAEAARRLRTALDPDGDWVAHVLRDAHARLTDLRAGADPDAGGLVVAIDKDARRAARRRLARVTGERPAIVTSDAPDASARIARFAAGSGTWLVSVLMVSEGVDVPRLRVGVYATTARTELFFRQVVGRFIRRTPRRRATARRWRTSSCPRTRGSSARHADRGGAQPRARTRDQGRGGRRRARARRGRRGLPRPVVERAPRRRRPADHPARRRAAAVRRGGARPEPGAGRLHHDRAGRHALAPGGRDRPRAARAPARGAPHARRRAVAPHGRGPSRDPRPHQPRDRCPLGRRRDGGPARARQPPARPYPRVMPDTLPRWPPGTVTVLATAAGAPHAIPVSTAVRAGDRAVLFALAPRRVSLARLRDRPAVLAGDPRRGRRGHRARPRDGRRPSCTGSSRCGSTSSASRTTTSRPS